VIYVTASGNAKQVHVIERLFEEEGNGQTLVS